MSKRYSRSNERSSSKQSPETSLIIICGEVEMLLLMVKVMRIGQVGMRREPPEDQRLSGGLEVGVAACGTRIV